MRTLAIHAAGGLAWVGLSWLVDPFAVVALPPLACLILAIVLVLREGWTGLRWGAILSSWAIGCGLLFFATVVLVRAPEVGVFCFLIAPFLSLATSLAVVMTATPPEDESTESDQF
jgi:hypothetical protein